MVIISAIYNYFNLGLEVILQVSLLFNFEMLSSIRYIVNYYLIA